VRWKQIDEVEIEGQRADERLFGHITGDSCPHTQKARVGKWPTCSIPRVDNFDRRIERIEQNVARPVGQGGPDARDPPKSISVTLRLMGYSLRTR
jgi:hypothetical protein